MDEYLDSAHAREVAALRSTFAARTEWPTWLLVVVVHGGWLAVVMSMHAGRLPRFAATPLLVILSAWHMSLQHELLHGHPTRSALVNRLLGSVPLAIWYPYTIYRDTHLAHHRDATLTMPGIDPESTYVLREQWNDANAVQRYLWRTRKRFVGRLIVGPPLSVSTMLCEAIGEWRRGDRRYARTWFAHAIAACLLLAWLQCAEGIAWWYYLLAVTWPALSVAMIRSLYEHRAADDPKHRIAINEAGLPMRLLYLNNNYHVVHHDLPGLPWYLLRRVYLGRARAYADKNGGYVIRGGYWELLKRYAWRETDAPVHPAAGAARGRRDAPEAHDAAGAIDASTAGVERAPLMSERQRATALRNAGGPAAADRALIDRGRQSLSLADASAKVTR
ncbi:fatty acid desaturase [Burkholderia dolosa]|uniref:fatty acid desaturase n=1 Tax=Burkholderia dolosa TaxID=152500 RepID=UPI0027D260BA|nr:fatty acid desaturase [Burkholderia dolosa]